MSNQKINKIEFSDFSNSLQKFSELSAKLFVDTFENNLKLFNEMAKLFNNSSIPFKPFPFSNEQDCCPPKANCPPHCLIEINKEAHVGEVLRIPFAIKNTCGSAKKYRIGLRPLLDQNGNPSNVQIVLDKHEIVLQPGQSVQLSLQVNLMQGAKIGDCLQTEIVIRENEINQNICFKLNVLPFCDVPTAEPLDEKLYLNHLQSWQSHYYCEQKPNVLNINEDISLSSRS